MQSKGFSNVAFKEIPNLVMNGYRKIQLQLIIFATDKIKSSENEKK